MFKKNNLLLLMVGLLFVALVSAACTVQQKTNGLPNQKGNSLIKLKNDNNSLALAPLGNVIKKVRSIDSTDHLKGALNSPMQIIVYSDFECPFCANFDQILNQVQDYFKDKVLVAYRHNPLRSHPMALTAALASECADEQKQFWPMHDKLFAANREGQITPEEITADAKSLNIDVVKFSQCLDTQKYKNKIQAQVLEAVNFGVAGSPGSFINGVSIPGAVPFEDYKASDGSKQLGMKSLVNKYLETK